jgi:uncharacterized protein YbjT (DUF2867 family)
LKLKAKGVEIVVCDITTATVEELSRHMSGCQAAFLLTNFWDPASMHKEYDLGKKLVDGAKAAGVKHVLWSGLDNVEKVSNGKYDVPHFTDKAKVQEYIESLQSKSQRAFESVTVVAPAFYFQNFKMFGMWKQQGDEWVLTLPETKFLTACDITELGPAVVAALENPKKFDTKRIEYWGEHAHPQTYVDAFTRVTGKKARYVSVPIEKYDNKELAHMFAFFNDYSYYGPTGAPFSETSAQRNTPGGLSNFSDFLAKGGWAQ